MKKTLVAMLKKAGEKTAEIPGDVRSWPEKWYQPEMPKALQDRMMKK